MEKARRRASHRKGLTSLSDIDIEFSRPSKPHWASLCVVGILLATPVPSLLGPPVMTSAHIVVRQLIVEPTESLTVRSLKRSGGIIATPSQIRHSQHCCLGFGLFLMALLNGRLRWIPSPSRSYLGVLMVARSVSSRTVLACSLLFRIFGLRRLLLSHQSTLVSRLSGLVCSRRPIKPFSVLKSSLGLLLRLRQYILL